jgi:hypothetical protein
VTVSGKLHGSVAALVIFASATPAIPCGFEDPSSVTMQRGVLNFVYPKSLWVSTAVWQAQLAGLIPQQRSFSGDQAAVGLLLAQAQMRRLGRLTDEAAGAGPVPRFTVVLLGTMLWTTYDDTGGTVKACVHASGPKPGDVVMVTDQAVVAALLAGSLGVRDANDLGLIRYYGDDDDILQLVQVLDDLKPLPGGSAINLADGGGESPKPVAKVARIDNADRDPAKC